MTTRENELNEIKAYTPPRLYTGKEWYIGFNAWDPAQGKMRRKKIKLNHIPRITERRKYANDLIVRLSENLRNGWNPWMAREDSKSYDTLEDAVKHFIRVQKKLVADDIIRPATYTEYESKLRNLLSYNGKLKQPITYIYQLDGKFLQEFVEHIYVGRKNTAQTHDNYIRVLSVFCKFLVKQGYHKVNSTEALTMLGRKAYKKGRTTISEKDLQRLHTYLNTRNKYFLLACYIEFYCLIRPKEMALIKIGDISFKNRTILIRAENAKNRKDAVVTLNAKVTNLMLDLKVYQYHQDCYLFSEGFTPGEEHKPEKTFRDYWNAYVKKDLKFPETYKFYSLKDSGVTMMLRSKVDSLSVRDQARHSSILMTDSYTPHDIQEANPILENFDSCF